MSVGISYMKLSIIVSILFFSVAKAEIRYEVVDAKGELRTYVVQKKPQMFKPVPKATCVVFDPGAVDPDAGEVASFSCEIAGVVQQTAVVCGSAKILNGLSQSTKSFANRNVYFYFGKLGDTKAGKEASQVGVTFKCAP
jgi:hypothetical protein